MRLILNRITQSAILVTFFLFPAWYRLPFSIGGSSLYVTRFLILVPMLIAIGTWLIGGVTGLRALRQSRWGAVWALALLLWALWASLSQRWAFVGIAHPEVGATAALQWGVVALFAVTVASTAPPARQVVATLLISLVGNSALTIAQALHQGGFGLRALQEFPLRANAAGLSVIVSGDLRWLRPYGLLPHPNILAGTLLIGCFGAAAHLFHERPRLRILGGMAALIGWGALLYTFSRAAWLGAAVGGLAFLLMVTPVLRGAIRRAVIVTAVAAAGIGIGFGIAYLPLLTARTGIGEEAVEMRSIADRLVFTDFAWRSIQERPIFGVGVGNFPWRASYYISETFYDLQGDNVHHVYLSAAAELGIIGASLLVLALGAGVIGGVAGVRDAPSPATRAEKAALVAGSIALAVIGGFDHYPYTILQMQTAWWACLAVALAKTPQRR